MKEIYGIPEAVQHSVYAIMQSPQLLYRTEIGDAKDQAGPLTAYELASSLSYFLLDEPPDSVLLTAAQQQKLEHGGRNWRASRPHACHARGTKKPGRCAFLLFPGRQPGHGENRRSGVHLGHPSQALHWLARVRLSRGRAVSGEHLVERTAHRAAYRQESRGSTPRLPSAYGITLPATSDESQFVETQVPENRGGLITQVGFLAANSRPDVPSVVARGLVVNKSMLCQTNPPFPTDPALLEKIEEAGTALASASERERSEYRTTTSPCFGCHRTFDAYGLALDTYDSIGRYRTKDPQGRAIDPSVTLPALFDNQVAADAGGDADADRPKPGLHCLLQQEHVELGAGRGLAADPDQLRDSGHRRALQHHDKSLSSLLREIAMSKAFTQRNAGGSP